MIKLRKRERGQVMTEYATMLAMFAGIVVILIVLLAVFTEYGWRLISLVSMEYP